jgi:hypothetical protein
VQQFPAVLPIRNGAHQNEMVNKFEMGNFACFSVAVFFLDRNKLQVEPNQAWSNHTLIKMLNLHNGTSNQIVRRKGRNACARISHCSYRKLTSATEGWGCGGRDSGCHWVPRRGIVWRPGQQWGSGGHEGSPLSFLTSRLAPASWVKESTSFPNISWNNPNPCSRRGNEEATGSIDT